MAWEQKLYWSGVRDNFGGESAEKLKGLCGGTGVELEAAAGLAMGDGGGRRWWRSLREVTFPSCDLRRGKVKLQSSERRKVAQGVSFFL